VAGRGLGAGRKVDEASRRVDVGRSSGAVSRDKTQVLPEEAERVATVGAWRVVVLNDPVNLMSYVVLVFRRVLGFDEATARRKMLEVHEQGRSVVWTGLREKAEAYAFTLQEWHLSAVVEADEAH
jgi:ATP-dependent Clp protease adaptor protein ClpS